MNCINRNLIGIIIVFHGMLGMVCSQVTTSREVINYEVNKVYPPISINKSSLKEAKTLLDINKYYKPSWVKEYISVEVEALINGKAQKAVNKSDLLSENQKKLIVGADEGSKIKVRIHYIPDNTLPQNDVAQENFMFTIDPEKDAQFIGGEIKLLEYFKTNAIEKIPAGIITGYGLAGVKFTVDENGEIINAHLWESSKNEAVDKLLLQTVCNMPNWNPAKYSSGTSTSQEFVLTVGNMQNCMVSLLNIKQR